MASSLQLGAVVGIIVLLGALFFFRPASLPAVSYSQLLSFPANCSSGSFYNSLSSGTCAPQTAVKICSTKITVVTTDIFCSSLPAYTRYRVEINITSFSTASVLLIAFNQDIGADYSYISCGTTATAANIIAVCGSATTTLSVFSNFYIWNNRNTGGEALVSGYGIVQGTGTALPTASGTLAGQWNSNAQINRIDLVNTASANFGVGSGMMVWGISI